MCPNDLRHNRVRDRLYIPLREFAARQGLGEATAETLFEFGPGTVTELPISRLWPLRKSEMSSVRGPQGLVPQLVVEVISPGKTSNEMTRRLRVYKNAGVNATGVLYL